MDFLLCLVIKPVKSNSITANVCRVLIPFAPHCPVCHNHADKPPVRKEAHMHVLNNLGMFVGLGCDRRENQLPCQCHQQSAGRREGTGAEVRVLLGPGQDDTVITQQCGIRVPGLIT